MRVRAASVGAGAAHPGAWGARSVKATATAAAVGLERERARGVGAESYQREIMKI